MNVILQAESATASPAGIRAIGLVGTGVMGRGVAQLFAAKGFEVLLFDIDPAQARDAVATVAGIIDRECAKGRMSADEATKAKARLTPVSGLDAFAGVGLVIEAIAEDLTAKQELFAALEKIVPAACILATNTSSLLVTAIAAKARMPERVCGMHFFNPVPLMKVAEVIAGVRTSPDVARKVAEIVQATGHTPVIAADMPGFLINHAGRGLYTEGLRIVSEGIAPVEDVDLVLREGVGFRMGPFELFDLTGLDVSYKVLTQIYHQFFEEPRYRPQPLAARQYSAGLFGRKVGRGFYRYKDGKPVLASPAPAQSYESRPIWIDATSNQHTGRIRKLFEGLGIPVASGQQPDADCIIVVAPIGHDATTAAIRGGFDPKRTLAIDPLFCDSGRLTVMTTPVTRPDYRDSLCGALNEAGAQTTVIRDSAGFIGQRTVATIVNIACDIAQQRIASPRDIDIGVKLGLGYPSGPLAMGDRIGARVVLEILEAMHEFYADPRYRPSPWLKRRALLGVSLATEEVCQ